MEKQVRKSGTQTRQTKQAQETRKSKKLEKLKTPEKQDGRDGVIQPSQQRPLGHALCSMPYANATLSTFKTK
jgi:hypothetical protein